MSIITCATLHLYMGLSAMYIFYLKPLQLLIIVFVLTPFFFSSNFHIFDSNIFRSSEPTQGVVKLYVSKIPLGVTEVNHKLK